jgi:O-methyltransferase
MIGIRRLENLQHCIESILKENVPGDLIETGVLSGGATIFMRAVLKAYGDTSRRVFVCDSFQNHPATPPPKVFQWLLKTAASVPDKTFRLELFRLLQKLAKSAPPTSQPSEQLVDFVMQILQNGDRMPLPTRDTSIDGVQSNFSRYGLLDEQVVFVEGYFADTLPELEAESFALIRLDGDLYESTMIALESLYPKLAKGGYCIIDDYYSFSDCSKAVEEYRNQFGINEPVETIDYDAVFWRKA